MSHQGEYETKAQGDTWKWRTIDCVQRWLFCGNTLERRAIDWVQHWLCRGDALERRITNIGLCGAWTMWFWWSYHCASVEYYTTVGHEGINKFLYIREVVAFGVLRPIHD